MATWKRAAAAAIILAALASAVFAGGTVERAQDVPKTVIVYSSVDEKKRAMDQFAATIIRAFDRRA